MSATRCGFVALIGAPNAGKSTLINALVGAKVAIVSRKAQTTRATTRGILIESASQIVFVDTPGLFAPKRRLDRAMAAAACSAERFELASPVSGAKPSSTTCMTNCGAWAGPLRVTST